MAEWVYDQVVNNNVIFGNKDTTIDIIMYAISGLIAGYVSLLMLKG